MFLIRALEHTHMTPVQLKILRETVLREPTGDVYSQKGTDIILYTLQQRHC